MPFPCSIALFSDCCSPCALPLLHRLPPVSKSINDSPNNGPPNAGAAGIQTNFPAPQPAMIWYEYYPSAPFPEVGSGSRTTCAGPVYKYNSANVA